MRISERTQLACSFSSFSKDDKVVRKFDYYGEFSIKSAYNTLWSQRFNKSDWLNIGDKKPKNLWSLKLPLKLVIFLWKT